MSNNEECYTMPEIDFNKDKRDPMDLVVNYLEKKHGSKAGAREVLRKMSAAEVLGLFDSLKKGQEPYLGSQGPNNEETVLANALKKCSIVGDVQSIYVVPMSTPAP